MKKITLSQDIQLDQILVGLFESGKKFGREEVDTALETGPSEPLWMDAKDAILELFEIDKATFYRDEEDADDGGKS